MKYDGGFLMQCFLLKLKSSSTYAHLRKSKIQISNFFDNDEHIYISNCYETVISKLCKLKLFNVFCSQHEESLPYIILQYENIGFHTESKRFRNIHLAKERTQMKTNKKLSRTSFYAKGTLPTTVNTTV